MAQQRYPVDDLFRNGLSDHIISPSEDHKSILLEAALKKAHTAARRRKWIIGLGILLFTAFLALLVIFIPEFHSTGNYSEDDQSVIAPTGFSTGESGKVETGDTPRHKLSYSLSAGYKTKEIIHAETDHQSKPADAEYPVAGNNTEQTSQDPDPARVTVSRLSTMSKGNPELSGKREALSSSLKDIGTTLIFRDLPAFPDSIIVSPGPDHPMPSVPEKNKPKKEPKLNFQLGVYYSPELMFNTLDGDKFVNNFGFEAALHAGPYFVRSGAGISITRGYNEVAITKQDYLGAYKALDSITFAWDEKHYRLLPTYFFKDAEAYDTTGNTVYHTITKQYTYLNIPLILGYDFFRRDRFSMGLRAGPVMSLLIHTENQSLSYDPGKDKIVMINDITPDRISLNWQAMGAVNVSFKVSRRLILELEPNIRYYFNSVYEKSGTSKKPWSAGFRSAILYQF